MADWTRNGCIWIDMASTVMEERVHDWWDWELDREEQPRPLLHQKRPKALRYNNIRPPKGIGFVRMFKGYRYPVGRKNL